VSVNSSFVLTGSTRVLAECWPVSLGRRTWYIVRSRARWGDGTIVKSNQAPASFDVVIIREGATQSISVRRQGTFTAYELNWTELQWLNWGRGRGDLLRVQQARGAKEHHQNILWLTNTKVCMTDWWLFCDAPSQWEEQYKCYYVIKFTERAKSSLSPQTSAILVANLCTGSTLVRPTPLHKILHLGPSGYRTPIGAWMICLCQGKYLAGLTGPLAKKYLPGFPLQLIFAKVIR